MKQVAVRIANALKAGKPLTVGNTRTDGHSVWLFGNKIMQTDGKGRPTMITLAGWSTITTRSRLNDLLHLLGSRVSVRVWKNAPHLVAVTGNRHKGYVMEKNRWHHVTTVDSRRGGLASAQSSR